LLTTEPQWELPRNGGKKKKKGQKEILIWNRIGTMILYGALLRKKIKIKGIFSSADVTAY